MKRAKQIGLQIFSLALILFTLAGCGSSPTGSLKEEKTDVKETVEKASKEKKPDLEESPVEDFHYEYDAETQGIRIKSYVGTAVKVRIPKEIEGEPVTCIGSEAFKRAGIGYVYIPDTVTMIEESAFWDCDGLASIEIPGSVKELGGGFEAGAFANCDGLTNVILHDGLEVIGKNTFMHCENLTEIKIPNSVTKLSGFKWCTGLTNIVIPDSVIEIGEDAFEECTNLKTVEISKNVEIIGDRAFMKCESLENIVLPDSVTEIGASAFAYSHNLKTVVLGKNIKTIKGGKSGTISGGAFESCASLESIEIPGSLTEIEESTFANCHNLKAVKIGEGVKKIGLGAFSRCERLESVEIPESLSEFYGWPFADCENLPDATKQKLEAIYEASPIH